MSAVADPLVVPSGLFGGGQAVLAESVTWAVYPKLSAAQGSPPRGDFKLFWDYFSSPVGGCFETLGDMYDVLGMPNVLKEIFNHDKESMR